MTPPWLTPRVGNALTVVQFRCKNKASCTKLFASNDMAIRETPVKSESLRGTTPEGEPCEKTLERDLYTLLAIGPDFYRLPRNTGTVTLHKNKVAHP